MKKINLLNPNLRKGYLGNGKGEKVEYLEIPEGLTLKALQEDVEIGANAFKEILEGAKKHLSRIIVIHSNNKENAFMAVNYLAGICNEAENICQMENNNEFNMEDEFDSDIKHYECSVDYFDEDWEDAEETDIWEEVPNCVPIIKCEELFRHEGSSEEYASQGFVSIGMPNSYNKRPYWMECNREAVCLFAENINYMYNFYGRLNTALDRFSNNKRVFVVIIDNNNATVDESFCMGRMNGEQEELEFILENTADLFYANAKEEDITGYRIIQFENWVSRYDVRLANKFPKKEIVEKIIKIKSVEKSLLMERVLRYVMKESQKTAGDELTIGDFAVLRKFKSLSNEERKEKNKIMQLEKELVGMDNVKEQVKNIVNLMKYNKQREKMGVGKACFHNAHLLIGAPGTAKTTVARLLGAMMFEENLLPGDRFICVNGADLKGLYVGHSAPKTHQIFENHDVILIDEAYSLTSTDGRGEMDIFAQEAIAQLILEIENHSMDKLVMFAGYGGIHVSEKNNKMKQFIDANPGLKSRINTTIYFDSYSAQQMVEIVHRQAKNQHFEVERTADDSIYEYFQSRVKDINFGNGREARSMLENAMIFAAKRVMQISNSKKTRKMMTVITKGDIENAICKMRESDKMQKGKTKVRSGFVM